MIAKGAGDIERAVRLAFESGVVQVPSGWNAGALEPILVDAFRALSTRDRETAFARWRANGRVIPPQWETQADPSSMFSTPTALDGATLDATTLRIDPWDRSSPVPADRAHGLTIGGVSDYPRLAGATRFYSAKIDGELRAADGRMEDATLSVVMGIDPTTGDLVPFASGIYLGRPGEASDYGRGYSFHLLPP